MVLFRSKRSFSLVELITVLAIIGVGIGIFYSVLFVNWESLERQLTLIDLQMEADRIIERVSFDGRYASDLAVSEDGKSVTFDYLTGGGNPVTYDLLANGHIQRTLQGSPTENVSEYIDFNNSFFVRNGNILEVNLMLNDNVFGRREAVVLRASTQISPRNLS